MSIKITKFKLFGILILLIFSSYGVAEVTIKDKTYKKIRVFSVATLCDEITNDNFINKKSFCINKDQYNSCLERSILVAKEAYLNELNRRGLKTVFCKDPLPIIGGQKQIIYEYCESPNTIPEISSCIVAETSHIDEKIDQTYIKLYLLFKNKKDNLATKKHHDSQISWIKERESICEEESMQSYSDTRSSISSINYAECKKRLSTERLKELKDILLHLNNNKQ